MNNRKSLYDVKSFYNKKEVLKASFRGMRYQVEQAVYQLEEHAKEVENDSEEQVLQVTIWPEPFCFEKTPEEKKTVQYFPYHEEGLDQAYSWICEQYQQRETEWTDAQKHPYRGLLGEEGKELNGR